MVAVIGNEATFKFFRPHAREVFLAGDLNGWRRGELKMVRDDAGYWRAVVYLCPGDFRFRYIADGQDFRDYAAFGIIPGPYGHDSVVHVEASRVPPADRLSVIQTGRKLKRWRANESSRPDTWSHNGAHQ